MPPNPFTLANPGELPAKPLQLPPPSLVNQALGQSSQLASQPCASTEDAEEAEKTDDAEEAEKTDVHARPTAPLGGRLASTGYIPHVPGPYTMKFLTTTAPIPRPPPPISLPGVGRTHPLAPNPPRTSPCRPIPAFINELHGSILQAQCMANLITHHGGPPYAST